jgi:amino acid transporter
MARAYPRGGSAFTYVGKELHPALGYLSGWCLVLDYVLNPLICTIWCSKAAVNFLPGLPYPCWVVIFAVAFTLLNLNGVETSARINAGIALVLTAVIVLIVTAAIRFLHAGRSLSPGMLLLPFYNPNSFSASKIFHGTSIAVLTYIGFDGISTLADETKDPQRTLPRAIVITCAVTGILAAIEAYLAQLCWPIGAAFPEIDTAYVHIAGRIGGPSLFAITNAALLIATIGSGMAAQLGAARILFSMGQQEALPKRFFGAVSSQRAIPANNVLLVGAICVVGGPLSQLRDRRGTAQLRSTSCLCRCEPIGSPPCLPRKAAVERRLSRVSGRSHDLRLSVEQIEPPCHRCRINLGDGRDRSLAGQARTPGPSS